MVEIKLKISTCKECKFWKEGPYQSTDGFDRGNDWICTKSDRKIQGFVEWHEVKKVKVPEWREIRIDK